MIKSMRPLGPVTRHVSFKLSQPYQMVHAFTQYTYYRLLLMVLKMCNLMLIGEIDAYLFLVSSLGKK